MSPVGTVSSQMILCGAQMSLGELTQRYLPGLREQVAIPIFENLATQVARAQDDTQLIATLTHSLVPGVWRWSNEIIAHLASEGRTPVDQIPLEFGVRAKVVEIVQRIVPIGPNDFLAGADPRIRPVGISLKVEGAVRDQWGRSIGEGRAVAGSEEGSFSLRRPDGTILSAMTTKGGRSYQEDGIYNSWFTLPDGTEVKVIVGADGAGGMGGGDVASSAWIQGIHAGVVEAARAGRVPLAGELFGQGAAVLQFQKMRPDLRRAARASGAGSIVVIVGDQATIATAGDAMVVFTPPPQNGICKSIGYTNVDSIGSFRSTITRGINDFSGYHLYHVSGLASGSRFVFGSDGLLENIIGFGYRDWGSSQARLMWTSVKGQELLPPSSAQFLEFDKLVAVTAGRENAAQILHDLALENIREPGREHSVFGRMIRLPDQADDDNIFAGSLEIGSVKPYPLQVPASYLPMEPISP